MVQTFTADQVLDLLDSSGESEIEEAPGFLLPHELDSECEEPLPWNSFTLHLSSQAIASEDSDSSDEECIAQGIIIDNHTNINNSKNIYITIISSYSSQSRLPRTLNGEPLLKRSFSHSYSSPSSAMILRVVWSTNSDSILVLFTVFTTSKASSKVNLLSDDTYQWN